MRSILQNLLDSTIWGQVDSFFTMIIIAALILLLDKRLEASAVLFTMAILMKPQGSFFLPILLFELIKRRKPRKFRLSDRDRSDHYRRSHPAFVQSVRNRYGSSDSICPEQKSIPLPR